MHKWFPDMNDKPDSQMIGAAVAYIFVAFILLPFFFQAMIIDAYGNETLLSWFELIFHLIGFVLFVITFRGYLADCFQVTKGNLKTFCKITLWGSVAALLVFGDHILMLFTTGSAYASYAANFALPIAEYSLVQYPVFMLEEIPVLTVLCLTLLAPVTISCIYYGTCFAPIAYLRPALAYVTVTVAIVIPRLANCLMARWHVDMELMVCLSQLPIHWIACYAYQRTNSIWSPILIHAVTNLAACLIFLVLI